MNRKDLHILSRASSHNKAAQHRHPADSVFATRKPARFAKDGAIVEKESRNPAAAVELIRYKVTIEKCMCIGFEPRTACS